MASIAAAAPHAQFVDTPLAADFVVLTEGAIPSDAKIVYSMVCTDIPDDAMTFSNV